MKRFSGLIIDNTLIIRNKIGETKKGKVINLTQFGAFVELDEGVDGLIHISDMSWTQIVKHPKEFLEKGQELNVQILDESFPLSQLSFSITKKALFFSKIKSICRLLWSIRFNIHLRSLSFWGYLTQ